MVQYYEYGEEGMMNYKLFIKAQRISWLKLLLYGIKEEKGFRNMCLATAVNQSGESSCVIMNHRD